MTGGRTREEAEILEARIRMLLIQGKDPNVVRAGSEEVLTLSDLIDRFLKHPRFLRGTPDWQEESRHRLNHYIRPQLGKLAFFDLQAERIYRFYLWMREERNLGRPSITKPHTLMGLLGDLHCELTGETDNVCRRLREFGRYFPKKAPKREINFLTPEELTRLYLECGKVQQRLLLPICQFLAHTGMRRSEALHLKWSDIDPQSGFIHIRQSKSGRSRSIPIELPAEQATSGLVGRSDFVFAYENGDRPHEDSFLKPLRKAAVAAGITKRIDLHTLRHSYGSNKIRQGWGLKKVSVLLGHSDITMTSTVYAHLLDGDLKVRDDVRDDEIDSATSSEKSGELKRRIDFVAKALADISLDALRVNAGLTAEGQLERLQVRLAQATEAIQTRLQRFESNAADTISSSSFSLRATPVLQSALFHPSETKTAAPGDRRKPKHSEDLSQKSIGRGDRIRTCDLFVPNEAR